MDIKIGKRTIPLFYSTYELIEIQKDIGCTGFELRDKVFGIVQEDEDDPMSIRMTCVTDPEKTERLGKLIRILGNAGLEEAGEEANLTDKWILRNMKTSLFMAYAIAAMAVITEGNKAEEPVPEKEEGPVDEVLEEQEAKKPQGK